MNDMNNKTNVNEIKNTATVGQIAETLKAWGEDDKESRAALLFCNEGEKGAAVIQGSRDRIIAAVASALLQHPELLIILNDAKKVAADFAMERVKGFIGKLFEESGTNAANDEENKD